MVGISSIIVNVGKVREMCRMVRELSPHSKIVVGGHVAAIPGLKHMITPTISCKAKASHGCAGTWGKIPPRPSATPASPPVLAFA